MKNGSFGGGGGGESLRYHSLKLLTGSSQHNTRIYKFWFWCHLIPALHFQTWKSLFLVFIMVHQIPHLELIMCISDQEKQKDTQVKFHVPWFLNLLNYETAPFSAIHDLNLILEEILLWVEQFFISLQSIMST